jgi:uncharacterized protein YjbJ (UPF0337 family)
MNRDVLKGQWKQLKGEIQRQWGELTDDEVDRLEGNAEKLAGLLQERYGWGREDAERRIDQWLSATIARSQP